MNLRHSLPGVLAILVMAVAARAETKVTLKKVHICCGMCVKAIETAVKKVDGAAAEVDKAALTVAITAADDATAQKAVNAVAQAGFFGASDNEKVKIRAVKAGKDKVERQQFAGVHNCCGGCAKAITAAVKGVSGVTGTNVRAKGRAFVVEGNFAPADVVKALNDAGFNVRPARKKKPK